MTNQRRTRPTRSGHNELENLNANLSGQDIPASDARTSRGLNGTGLDLGCWNHNNEGGKHAIFLWTVELAKSVVIFHLGEVAWVIVMKGDEAVQQRTAVR
jgi:hypothetical protein